MAAFFYAFAMPVKADLILLEQPFNGQLLNISK